MSGNPEASLRVMIVEDEAIAAMYLEQAVEKTGHKVVAMIDNGEEAIRSALNLRPDLVLMDIRIRGDIDGVMAAYSIKAATGIPTILVSAYRKNELRQYRNVEEDFMFLCKPVLERDLHDALESIFAQPSANP